MKRSITSLIALSVTAGASGQATVPYASPGWKDLGTTNVTGLTGNFLPGWTALTASPDLGDDVFFVPTQSLSGLPGDAAIWMLNYDPGSIGAPANESVRLSLDGFTIGQTYELSFWATLVTNSFAGWVGNNDPLTVDLAGADISSFVTSPLNDPIDADGLNPWVPISISFVALSTNVQFDFGATPVGLDPAGLATRIGIDGLDARLVPAPGSLALLTLGGLLGRRHRP